MAYTGNPSTDTSDQVRLLLGDVSTSSPIFADDEIDFFVSAKANVYFAAAAAVSSLIGTSRAKTMAGVVSKAVGDLKLSYGDNTSVTETLQGKIRQLRLEGSRSAKPYAGGISEADKDAAYTDTDWAQPSFQRGLYDHPSLGEVEREADRFR